MSRNKYTSAEAAKAAPHLHCTKKEFIYRESLKSVAN